MQEAKYFKLYKFFTSKEIVFVRIIFFALLTIILLLFIDNYEVLLRLAPLYFVLFLQELFIHRKLERTDPVNTVNDTQNIYSATKFDVRVDLESTHSSYELAKAIANSKQGKFLLNRINPEIKLTDVNIKKEDLVEKATTLVKALNGKYIHSVDILAAYLILQEEIARTLEKENLSPQDVLTILYWVRDKYKIEKKDHPLFSFNGNGVFDQLVYGWTPETHNFTSDFTNEVLRLGYEPKAIGRDKEYRQIIDSLSRSSSSNVLLIGNPGVGKTNLVMDFSYDAYHGTLTKNLKHKRIYFLFIDRLLSGASNKGEIEQRLNSIFTEVSHAGNIIVFIENIENIFGGGGFNFDISGAIQPYLSSNKVQIIGTTNPQAYKDFVASKPSIHSLFNSINLSDPDEKIAIFMLLHEAEIREKLSKAVITYGAIKEAVESASLYAPDLSLPGSGVHLLEDTMVRSFHEGKNVITASDIKQIIIEKTGVNLSTPTADERKDLLNMEEILHKNLIGQDEAVISVSNAVRRLRSGLKKEKGPIASFLFLGPTGVGKTTTAKLLASEYFHDEKRMVRVDMSEYQSEESIKKLLGEMPGEQSFSNSFLDQIQKNPFSVVLLDEFEKANPRLLDVFLQVLDEGFVTNNKGKKISFSNAIIIATSNAGSEFIREKIVTGNENIKDQLIEYILTKGIFRPELVNRFDDVIVFHPLSQDQTRKIVEMRLNELREKLLDQHINISFSDPVVEKISKESFDPDFGARNIRRYIEENIENLISRLILEEKIKKNENVMLTLNQEGNYTINQ